MNTKINEVENKIPNTSILVTTTVLSIKIIELENDGFQKIIVYQPTFDTLELKKDISIDYVLSWKSKGVYSSKLKPLYIAFLHSIKLSGYNVWINFDKDPLAVEQNNYLTKIVNVYIVYDLDAWPRNPFQT